MYRAAWIRSPNHLARFHDEPVGRGADVAERIAGYQRQFRSAACPEYAHVLRSHDAGSFPTVSVAALSRLEDDHVVRTDVSERTKDRIAMARHADVAWLARHRGVRDVAESQTQSI